MRADLLHVVTAFANPLRWESRRRLFDRFRAHMHASGVDLTVVECAYGERPHELVDAGVDRHVPVRAQTMIWTKENLLNLGIARLPDHARYVAWIDADVFFRDPDWAARTVDALQLHDVVQPWTDCYDLGPRGEHLTAHRSFAKQYRDGCRLRPGYDRFAHPGYAWAATRNALDCVGGLVETAALGAADHHMAMVGTVELSIPDDIGGAYRRPLQQWQDRATRHLGGNLGFVRGAIEHQWHGPKRRRRYVERWDVLKRHAFDPANDLRRNTWGVLELARNKPAFARDVAAYFGSRDEDSNDMTGEA